MVAADKRWTYLSGTAGNMHAFWRALGVGTLVDDRLRIPTRLDDVHTAACKWPHDRNSLANANSTLLPIFVRICADLARCEAVYRLGGAAAVLAYVSEAQRG